MAPTGEPSPGNPLVLEPMPPRFPGDAWKHGAEGSLLSWDPATRAFTYVAPRKRPESGWRLVVGQEPHGLRTVVHVRGDLPFQVFGLSVGAYSIDAYAFADEDGVLLVPGVESGAAELYAGWFRPAAVRDIAGAMAVEFREDRVASWRDLNRRYAGLVSGSRGWERMVRVEGVAYYTLGIVFSALGLLGIVLGIATRTPAAAAGALVMVPVGVSLIHVATELRRGVGRREGPSASKRASRDGVD